MPSVQPGEHDALVEALAERDERALVALINEFGPLVFAVARRIVAEPGLAEEVAQDTFLALWRRPGAFDPERGSLQSFLLSVARNKAVDLVRKEESLRRSAEALLAEVPASAGDPAAEPMEGVEERHGVRDALARLSPVQREAIVLAYFGGRTYREVAAELGIPEGTAKTRLRDGLLRLRELMASSRGSGR